MAREVPRFWPALVLVLCATASGAAPSYSAAGIVNTASYTPAPFAANSLVTIFGAALADGTRGIAAEDIVNNSLPTVLLTTHVYVNDVPAPLLYVSEGQVNLLIAPSLKQKTVAIRVVRNGQTGPEIILPVADAAPGLFVAGGFAIATHADGSLVAPETPARPGELVVIYAAGLGKTLNPPTGTDVPRAGDEIANRASLQVTLDGAAIDSARIGYAGVTPSCAGLYQLNITLPAGGPTDPELLVSIGDATSQRGLRLVLRPVSAQLSGAARR